MNSKKLFWIISTIVIVIAVGWFYMSDFFKMPAPQSLDEIYKFTSNYEVANLSREDLALNTEMLNEADKYVLNNIDIKGDIVNFAVARFPSVQNAGELFKEFRALGKAKLERYNFELNIPWVGAYWTVTSNGKTYSLWTKSEWVLFMMGEKREAVKNLERDLKEFLD